MDGKNAKMRNEAQWKMWAARGREAEAGKGYSLPKGVSWQREKDRESERTAAATPTPMPAALRVALNDLQ